MSRLERLWQSLAETGRLDGFHFFVLSDTTDSSIAEEERRTWASLRDRLGAGGQLFYRPRESNAGKKAGNIAQWGHSPSAPHAHMGILHAPRVMAGDTPVRRPPPLEGHPP